MAGMKLIFFIEAHMVLCFGFRTTTVLIIHQWFCYCWTVLAQCQSSCFPTLCPRK